MRASRANTATEVTPTASAALVVPNPRRMTTLSDSRSAGIASSTSTTRMSTSSTAPPAAPAVTPIAVPATSPTRTATRAPVTECEAPWMTRAKTSRPVASVPNQWAGLGPCNAAATVSVGLAAVNSPGASAHATAIRRTRAGTTVPGRSTRRGTAVRVPGRASVRVIARSLR